MTKRARTDTLLVVSGLTVTAGVGVLVSIWPDQTVTILLVAGVVGALLLLRQRLAPSILSPVYLATVGYLGFAIAGQLLFGRVTSAGLLGTSIRIELSGATISNTSRLILTAAVSIIVGALFFTMFAGRETRAPRLHVVKLTLWAQSWLLVGATVLLLTLVTSYGWRNLLHRPSYLTTVSSHPVYVVAAELSMAAALGLGFLLAAGQGGRRLFAVLLFTGYAVVCFSTGSRRFAMLPMLFMLGVLSSAVSVRRWRLLLPAVLASLALVRVSLYTRSLSEHGLFPYLHALPNITTSPVGWEAVLRNLLIGFGIIGKTAFDTPQIPGKDFLVSLSPMPGDLAGWYEIAGQHRLNTFTPFAALGELGNHGWVAVVSYYLVAGIVLAYLDARVRTLLFHGQQLYGLVLVGMACVFVVLSTAYNLRSATRLLYYAIAADLIIRIWLGVIKAPARG